MRIGFFIPGWPPGKVANGIVTSIGSLGENLERLGHEVFYITPLLASQTENANVILINPFNESSFFEKLQFKWNPERALYNAYSKAIANSVAKLVADRQIEIFQMEETQGWATEVVKRVQIPVVVRLCGPWFVQRELGHEAAGDAVNLNRVAREGVAISNAAALVGASNAVIEMTRAYYGRMPNRTAIIPNSIRVKEPSLRWKLETCDKNLLLFVGRFDRIKGADVVLRSFAKLAAQREEIRLMFIGPDLGLAVDGEGLVKLDRFCSLVSENLRSRVDYRGILSREEIESLRAKAYLTIVASRYETFPNVVMEAMACGCPVIASDAGGIPEIVVDRRNGILVPSDSIDCMASAMSELLDTPHLAEQLGAQAALDCESWFDPARVSTQTIQFYNAVIADFSFKKLSRSDVDRSQGS